MTARYGLKPGLYNRILLLAEVEADHILEAAFVTNRHYSPRPSYEN